MLDTIFHPLHFQTTKINNLVYITAGTHTLTGIRAYVISIKSYYSENVLEIDNRLQEESMSRRVNLNDLSD